MAPCVIGDDILSDSFREIKKVVFVELVLVADLDNPGYVILSKKPDGLPIKDTLFGATEAVSFRNMRVMLVDPIELTLVAGLDSTECVVLSEKIDGPAFKVSLFSATEVVLL